MSSGGYLKSGGVNLNILRDILDINQKLVPKTFKSILKNWSILLAGFVYSAILIILWQVAHMFWILAGIVITLVQSALISNYLYLIENIIQGQKISIDEFKNGFKIYIFKIYGIMIVIWFVNYGASLFLGPIINIRIGVVSLLFLIKLVAFLLLNPLPEVIYQKYYHIGETFRYSYDFIKENWIEWFVPNFILGLLFYTVFGGGLALRMFLGGMDIQFTVRGLSIYLGAQFLLAFTMIYRGLLFEILSSTSRRKRMFIRDHFH